MNLVWRCDVRLGLSERGNEGARGRANRCVTLCGLREAHHVGNLEAGDEG